MVALNAWRPRFWCRYLCPLGAFLGIFSWRPLLRRNVKSESCNQCDLCGMSCHGAAVGTGSGSSVPVPLVTNAWKPMECLGCMDCNESCRRNSLSFQFTLPWRKEPKVESIDLGRRGMMAATIGGLVTLAAMRISPQARGRTFNPALIRPPGTAGARVPRALHRLRAVHEGLPDRRPPAHSDRSRLGRSLDPDARAPDRLLRLHVQSYAARFARPKQSCRLRSTKSMQHALDWRRSTLPAAFPTPTAAIAWFARNIARSRTRLSTARKSKSKTEAASGKQSNDPMSMWKSASAAAYASTSVRTRTVPPSG